MTAKRHRCGAIVQRTVEERVKEIRAVGVTARERVYELSKTNAEKPEAGYAIGRALIQGHVTSTQAEAARIYEQAQVEHRRAILARNLPSGGDLERSGGFDASEGTEPSYVESCERAERAMRDSRRALLEADPLAQLAVDAWVIENKEAHGLLGELRVGLNALARLYRVRVSSGHNANAA